MLGVTIWVLNMFCTNWLGASVIWFVLNRFWTVELHASVNEPNSAVAASTAVAMAMPLVMALVVLPTASRSVRIFAPSSSMSPDISAMPCALSETGPKVSMATMTPTVVSRPVPATATKNSARATEPPPSRNAP